jgi:hypothetical protein
MPDATRPLPPCRLHVILAAAAPRAVILRRGPSTWTQLILWHTDTDTFEYGQWFHGRLFGPDSALSPDGSLFLYLAAKWKLAGYADPVYTHVWTAISKPPYLTALALWPQGHEPLRKGGGLFIDDTTIWLRQSDMLPHPDHLPLGLTIIPSADPEHVPAEVARVVQGSWQMRDEGRLEWNEREWVAVAPQIWEKPQPHASYGLIESLHDRWGKVRRYSLLDRERDVLVPLDAAWADWDQQGRLVFTRAGKVFAGTLQDGAIPETLLADLNPQQFREVIAPDWATHW